jgi:hypothetical protein
MDSVQDIKVAVTPDRGVAGHVEGISFRTEEEYLARRPDCLDVLSWSRSLLGGDGRASRSKSQHQSYCHNPVSFSGKTP